MADSTAFPFSVFRLTSTGDSEATIANKEAVGFTIGVDDAFDAGLLSYKPVADARRTDVGNPSNIVPSSPDTGITPPIFELEFMIDQRLDDNSKMLARLMIMMLENKNNDDFPKGRTGVRYDAKSELNINPTGIAGGKTIHFDFIDDMAWGGLVLCRLQILFDGDPAALITALTTKAT